MWEVEEDKYMSLIKMFLNLLLFQGDTYISDMVTFASIVL